MRLQLQDPIGVRGDRGVLERFCRAVARRRHLIGFELLEQRMDFKYQSYEESCGQITGRLRSYKMRSSASDSSLLLDSESTNGACK